MAVAFAARQLIPDLPWAAAIALGALLAPPDAVAALAVLRQVDPPHRIRKVLEGESLLNDASALLLYKLAVGAVVARQLQRDRSRADLRGRRFRQRRGRLGAGVAGADADRSGSRMRPPPSSSSS